MKKKYVLLSCFAFIAAGLGYHYFSTWGKCFAGGGGTTIVPANEVHSDQEIRPGLRMFRTAAEGCLTGVASDAYKNVSCGYRNSPTLDWVLGKIEIKMDSVSQYYVECVIPPLGGGAVVEYYFEYTAWKNPPQRVTSSQNIK